MVSSMKFDFDSDSFVEYDDYLVRKMKAYDITVDMLHRFPAMHEVIDFMACPNSDEFYATGHRYYDYEDLCFQD